MSTTPDERYSDEQSRVTRPFNSLPAYPQTGRSPAWIGGLVLILIGAFFLLQNFGWIALGGNWWALFILIPAVVTAGTALMHYCAAGNRLTPAARGSLISSLVLFTVATIFLFDLD